MKIGFSPASGLLTAHNTLTDSVHGVGSNVVGKDDAVTLTNKTIDADNNPVSNLAHGAEVDNPSSGVHGVVGDVVGSSDTQTISNKTLSDLISMALVNTDGGDPPTIVPKPSTVYGAFGCGGLWCPNVDDNSYLGWGGAGDIALLRWKGITLSDFVRFYDVSLNYIGIVPSAPAGSNYTLTLPAATGTFALACKYINQGNFGISGKFGFGKGQNLLGQIWIEDDGLHVLWKGKERIL